MSASIAVNGWEKANAAAGRRTEPTKPMEDVIAEVMAMGHDPHSKKNSTTVDYVSTLHHDTRLHPARAV
jgi:hypothetical protein